MIHIGELILKTSIPINKVLDVQMSGTVNDHVKFIFVAEVDAQSVSKIYDTLEGAMVSLEAQSQEEAIFQGMVEKLKIKEVAGYFQVYGECISLTKKLDILLTDCSFQDKNLSYSDVIQSTVKKYSHSTVITSSGEFNSIGTSIIQYEETDWDFILRMAGNIRTVVVPSYTSSRTQFYFGPSQKVLKFTKSTEFGEGRASFAFLHKRKHYRDVSAKEYKYYRFRSEEILKLGDWIPINNEFYMISKQELYQDKGVLQNIYFATKEEYVTVPYFENEKLRGLSLTGKVIDTDDSNIKIHLDIDEEQEKETAYWYPYLPPVGNVMYTMPQIGTRAFLRLKNSVDGQGEIVHCQRTNGLECSNFSDVSKRYHTTEFGKRMSMLPTVTSVSGAGNFIAQEDKKGISASTNLDVDFQIKGSVSVHSKKKIKWTTPSKILMTRSEIESALEMSNSEILIQNDTINFESNGSTDTITYPEAEDFPAMEMGADLAAAIGGSVPSF